MKSHGEKSHEVLREACKTKGCKQVAAGMKVSVDLVHKWGRGRADGRSVELNPLDRVAALLDCTDDERLLDWLCQRRGGRFVRAAEMPSLVRRWWALMKSEMEQLLKAGRPQPGARIEVTGGVRCRFRLSGGRCGFSPAARN